MRVYISGIGGAGMGPLAHLALDAGFEVVGSDAVKTLFVEEIESREVNVSIGQSIEEIAQTHNEKPIDWIVASSAVPPTHPHVLFAAQEEIRISKRDELLNYILDIKQLKLIGIAGTHGKTTTTAMTVWALKQLGVPVSYSIGSNISFGRSAAYEEGSEFFIYEADEFDKNFLKFNPYASIITNISHDHPDTYPTKEDYENAFSDYIGYNKDLVVMWDNDHEKIKDNLPMASYVKNPSPFIADANRIDPQTSKLLDEIGVVGRHNRENAFLVITMIFSLLEDEEFEKIIEVMGSFPGTQRRFEKITPNLISDYAHHPEEIAGTIQIAQEYAQENGHKDIVVVYQPHQNARQHEAAVQEGYKSCFKEADKVYWLPTYLSRENPNQETLTPEYLASLAQGVDITVSEFDESLKKAITQHIENGNLVVCMGAGSIDGWIRENFSA